MLINYFGLKSKGPSTIVDFFSSCYIAGQIKFFLNIKKIFKYC